MWGSPGAGQGDRVAAPAATCYKSAPPNPRYVAMTSYCVFTADHVPLADPRAVVLVRDGFSWPAALLTVPWALAHRLWFVALGAAGLQLGLALLPGLTGLQPGSAVIAGLGLAAAFGWHASDLRTRDLWRRGYRVDGMVVARVLEDAERRYFAERRLVTP